MWQMPSLRAHDDTLYMGMFKKKRKRTNVDHLEKYPLLLS